MSRGLLLTIFFSVGLIVSCGDDKVKPVSPGKMTQLMTDIHLAEVYTSIVSDSSGLSGTKNTDTLALYYKSVLEHHGVTADEFKTSLRWYSDHPQELDSVYMDILNELSTMEGLVNADRGEE